MKRFDSMVIAILLILVLLVYGKTFIPQLANLFTDTATKIQAVQMMKA